METGTDPTEAFTECVQNSVDSILPPLQELGHITKKEANLLPNENDIWIPDDRSDDIVFMGQDHGLSTAKDYDYNINKFISAAKGTSTKREHPWSSGRKGVGMFQFLQLANKIEIVSQDTDHKGCIYRFYIYWGLKDGKKFPFFSEPEYNNITPEFQKHFGIFRQGTKLTFFDATEATKGIHNLREAATNKIRDTFGLIMARNPNLTIKINGDKLEPPRFMTKHKEVLIVPKLGITGNLYEDRNGMGEVEIFGQGGLCITSHQFHPRRRFSGYLVCPSWTPDTGRKQVKQDNYWKNSIDELNKFVEIFPIVQYADENTSSDKKVMDMFTSIIPEALRDLLPVALVQGSRNEKPAKRSGTGHIRPERNEEQTPGYPEPKPKQRHKLIKLRRHRRDNTHQQFVGLFGVQRVMRNDHTDQKQEKNPPIVFKKQRLGRDVALLDLVMDVNPGNPWVLYINTGNPLYLQKFSSPHRNRKEFVQRMAEQLAMVRMQCLQYLGKLHTPMELEEFRRELEKNTALVLT